MYKKRLIEEYNKSKRMLSIDNMLTLEEDTCIKLRYGLTKNHLGATQEDVADMMNIGVAKCRKIEESAKDKLNTVKNQMFDMLQVEIGLRGRRRINIKDIVKPRGY
jgi:DNA-directed RNA polymerase sigma subunit (sigma70/sigma32)